MCRSLIPAEMPQWHLLNGRLDGPQIRYGASGKEKKPEPYLGSNDPCDVQSVAYSLLNPSPNDKNVPIVYCKLIFIGTKSTHNFSREI